ncbi:acyl-CoA carboxylase subunit epsilon [Marmoricola endophyticus]|uniref:acyl-CoA carboxylase subunit epsilon n=1 Tax=Marmoricola endophyticus TaxID=2040280 RepID=UPI00166C3292|nr:acyl-CoA carboxylase subunit epsilon [Marmoricola endophyticus]
MSDEAAEAPETPARPVLRVITPSATPEEVAAITAVFAALAAGSGEAPAKPKREWAAPARMHRPQLQAGRGAWRASALPR